MGAHFIFNRDFTEFADGMYLSGEIPRLTSFEQPDARLVRADASQELFVDPLLDDQTLIIDSKDGLYPYPWLCPCRTDQYPLSCPAKLPGRPIHTIIGGTHLGFATDEQFTATVEALRSFDIKCLAASHCTGLERGADLAQAFGSIFRFAPVGTTIHIP